MTIHRLHGKNTLPVRASWRRGRSTFILRRGERARSTKPLSPLSFLFSSQKARACHPERRRREGPAFGGSGEAGPSLRARSARFAQDDRLPFANDKEKEEGRRIYSLPGGATGGTAICSGSGVKSSPGLMNLSRSKLYCLSYSCL